MSPARFRDASRSRNPGRPCFSGIGVYLPEARTILKLQGNLWGEFRLLPGKVAIGARLDALDARFTPAVGGPEAVTHAQAYEIRFPGGLGYVTGNGGIAERLVLYVAPA